LSAFNSLSPLSVTVNPPPRRMGWVKDDG
jgi:hypothetical protein